MFPREGNLKKLFALMVALLALLSLLTANVLAGGPTQVAQSASVDTAKPPELSGAYRGHVDARNGIDAFQLTVRQDGQAVNGELQMYKGLRRDCQGRFVVTGAVQADGTIALDAPAAPPAQKEDCGRKIALRNEGGKWKGRISGPTGVFAFELQK